MRAKLTNPSETPVLDSDGEWIMGHQVPLGESSTGLTRLTNMASMAIEEAMAGVPHHEWSSIPILLCVAEEGRPGRVDDLDHQILSAIERDLGVTFGADSAIVASGRVSAALALSLARTLLYEHNVSRVLIAATDSLLTWATLTYYENQDRILTTRNSNGFMPGEGAGALLVGRPSGGPQLVCTGLGFGVEKAHIDSAQPLRGDGLTHAFNKMLAEAGVEMHEMDFRIADLSGEQYYFKEAVLALSRVLRRPKEEFDIWHPAECTGEAGALAGLAIVALADAACRQGFGYGPAILAHMANDTGERAALSLRFRSS